MTRILTANSQMSALLEGWAPEAVLPRPLARDLRRGLVLRGEGLYFARAHDNPLPFEDTLENESMLNKGYLDSRAVVGRRSPGSLEWARRCAHVGLTLAHRVHDLAEAATPTPVEFAVTVDWVEVPSSTYRFYSVPRSDSWSAVPDDYAQPLFTLRRE